MTSPPYLLDSRCVAYTGANELLLRGLLDLGKITRSGAVERGRLENAGQCVLPEARSEWERLLALEWLLAWSCGAATVADALDAFADRPLSDSLPGSAMPTARQLAQTGAAVALVPLASPSSGSPGVAALILSTGNNRFANDPRAFWEAADAFSCLDGIRLDVVRTAHADPVNSGTSWQLGAALAARALATGDPAVRLDLASAWLPTGSVRSDGTLEAIAIGNKTDLPVIDRRWLIPAGNPPHSSMRNTGYAHAPTLEIAWNHLARQGTIEEGGSQPWPTGIDALHSFVSGAREPVIAAALLSNVQRLVLWRTPNETVSRKPAEDIKHILAALEPGLKVEYKDTPSNSMHAIERCLAAELDKTVGTGQSGLFNVTQGNRIMGFAAHTLARRYPSLWMLYRDNDDMGTDFTAIRYDGRDYPVTFTLSAAEHVRPEICWQNLLRPSVPRVAPPWQELLEKIRSSERKPC